MQELIPSAPAMAVATVMMTFRITLQVDFLEDWGF